VAFGRGILALSLAPPLELPTDQAFSLKQQQAEALAMMAIPETTLGITIQVSVIHL
jgi:hypothetical protein